MISCARIAIKGIGVDWTTEVAERVPLDQVREAMLRYEDDMTRGKVLLVPSSSGETDPSGDSDGIMRAKAPWRLGGDAYMVDLKMPEEVPMTTTERAYTSPIWYNP